MRLLPRRESQARRGGIATCRDRDSKSATFQKTVLGLVGVHFGKGVSYFEVLLLAHVVAIRLSQQIYTALGSTVLINDDFSKLGVYI